MTTDEFPLYRYRGTVLRVIDGDSIEISLDFGMRVYHTMQLRIAGINAPEIVGGDRAAALAAAEALESLVTGQTVYVRTHRDGRSFARYVGDIFVLGADGELVDVAALLVAGGYAERVS